MAIIYDRKEKCGEATFRKDGQFLYKVDLYVGNCFLLMVSANRDEEYLHSFFADEEHMNRCLEAGIYKDLVSIDINKAKCCNWKKIVAAIAEHTDGVTIRTYTEGEYTWTEWKGAEPTIPDIRMRELAEQAICYLKDRDELEDFCDEWDIEFDEEEKSYFGIYDDEEDY